MSVSVEKKAMKIGACLAPKIGEYEKTHDSVGIGDWGVKLGYCRFAVTPNGNARAVCLTWYPWTRSFEVSTDSELRKTRKLDEAVDYFGDFLNQIG